jgi:hypothetical protein
MELWKFCFYRFRYNPFTLPPHGALGVLILQIQVSPTHPTSTWGSGSSASTDSGITHSPFLNMGLWEFCFYRFRYNPLLPATGSGSSAYTDSGTAHSLFIKHRLWTGSYTSTDSTDSGSFIL